MRILLVVAHYFKAEAKPSYSSVNAAMRDRRRRALESMLVSWRADFSETASLNIGHRMTEIQSPTMHLDIVIAVNETHHLIDESLQQGLGLALHEAHLDNPRLLPFEAHRIMADRSADYDWFVYSEDDLLLHDAGLFRKLSAFQQVFGPKRLLQPNRYEINTQAWRLKTYIDGDLRTALADHLWHYVSEEHQILTQKSEWGLLTFARARNPHSGFFALSAEQFALWKAQPHFLDLDCSFVSPLESAASLGLVKTFSVFKPSSPNLDYFEIEHLDRKFSGLRLPIMYRGG